MGKGGRCPEPRAGRNARCETPKPSWGSSARGGTLESRVLRKAHARFGEGRMEKCSRSNSPAAYSTLAEGLVPKASAFAALSGQRSSAATAAAIDHLRGQAVRMEPNPEGEPMIDETPVLTEEQAQWLFMLRRLRLDR